MRNGYFPSTWGMSFLLSSSILFSKFASTSAFCASNRVIHSSIIKPATFSSTGLRMSSTSETKKRVLVPIADDSEEIETTCITDVLTRFGAEVVVASVKTGGELVCKMSRGIKVVADISIEEATGQEWDLIALPGGMPGAEHLRDCTSLISLLEKQKANGKLYAAICASPAVVFANKGLVGEGATSYPAEGFRKAMVAPVDDDVVVQGNVITSKGPGTALKFGLTLGEKLYGAEKAKAVADGLLV
mmetsp:Transcript_7234/g.14842  ORF Transcript_7234/g.14842 Transcript_7234/m.14842 type:complete len:245 (+) Transcript_7234:46-780(+)